MKMRILFSNLLIINTFKFYCFLSGMPKISAIIILTNVHHQDSFKTLGGLKGYRDCWDYFMIPLGGVLQTSSKPMRLKRLRDCWDYFMIPFGGCFRLRSKPKRLKRLRDCPRFARASGVSTLKQMPGLRPLSFFIAVALENKFSALHQ